MPTTRKGYTDADMTAVSDNPEWTEADFKNAKPFAEAFPELAHKLRGRPKAESPKRQVTLRLDADVLEHFRAGGPGWQSRINADLRKVAGLK
ncbi:BrnA antitoxin family protein [Oleispirillum naphthae]|uniref:BrnA antitoxin family protein n=1 Tax=Oleispirillum naphthae TaxID=2838853 RepID=UPI0030822FB3